jgi:hypothetical protein
LTAKVSKPQLVATDKIQIAIGISDNVDNQRVSFFCPCFASLISCLNLPSQ